MLLSVPFSYLQPTRCHPELGQARYSNFTSGIQWRGSKRRENGSSRPFSPNHCQRHYFWKISNDLEFDRPDVTYIRISQVEITLIFVRSITIYYQNRPIITQSAAHSHQSKLILFRIFVTAMSPTIKNPLSSSPNGVPDTSVPSKAPDDAGIVLEGEH